MVKCPFCQYPNEDGALFCEQCKSDLGTAAGESPPMAAPVIPAQPAGVNLFQAHPGEGVPVAAVIEDPAPPTGAKPVEEAPFAFLAAPAPATPAEPAARAPKDAETPQAAEAETVQPGALPMTETSSPTAPPAPGPTPAVPVAAVAKAQTALSAPASPPDVERLPDGAQPKLVVLRGKKLNVEFPLYEGHNFIGRADEKPVDIDLEDQEDPDRIWSSRQHAIISYEDGRLTIEDLNSSNGTFVNRSRIHPGQKRHLRVNDVIQIGTVQMKVKL